MLMLKMLMLNVENYDLPRCAKMFVIILRKWKLLARST
jgi:hypothetical protein